MKYLNLAVRFIVVGTVWSIVFATLFRSFVYGIWGFDPAFMKHWSFLWQMWRDGWVIDTPSEWFFFLAIFLFLPFWLLGWLLLARYPWGEKFFKLLHYPMSMLEKFHRRHLKKRVLVITRKKSYRKVRPPALSYVISSNARAKPKKKKSRKDSKDDAKIRDRMDVLSGKKSSNKTKNAEYIPTRDEIDNDDDDDIFDRDSFLKHLKMPSGEETAAVPAVKSAQLSAEEEFEQRRREEAPPWEYDDEPPPPAPEVSPEDQKRMRDEGIRGIEMAIERNGFALIKDVRVNDIKVDFVGISGDRILTAVIDNVAGDWLADEERFNDEDPLWFSETSHRVSPVRRLLDIAGGVKEKLGLDDAYEADNILIIEDSKVINAVDMMDIWEDMNVSVCRFGTGGPVSLPIFQDVVQKAEKETSSGFVTECEKALKG
ncbi:MAG: hypothetical protein IKD08_03050 [Alphaproteobacteria bacterium]|nr:hypothetical protein [Alphaproteobacteria bacterium]